MPRVANKEGRIFKKILEKYVEEIPLDSLKLMIDQATTRQMAQACSSFSEMIAAWEEAMFWSEDLEYGLSCLLATVASTMSVGEQLWIRLISPPASGKSTICEAVSRNKQYVHAVSTLKGFHSGFGDGKKDYSLLSKANGKTLVIKDGDTLMCQSNLQEILAEARDIYDGVSRTSNRNKVSRVYEGIRLSFCLSGTNSIRSLDDSELGERFLDCVMMKGIDEKVEEKILRSLAKKIDKDMGVVAAEGVEGNPKKEKAYALTSGYLNWIRENAQAEMNKHTISQASEDKLVDLARYVAYMRAKPSTRQSETVEREMATRVFSQLARLAKSLTAVRQCSMEEIMPLVERCAKDTAKDSVTRIIRIILKENAEQGVPKRTIELRLGEDEQKDLTRQLNFMKDIRLLQRYKKGKEASYRWRVSGNFKKIWDRVHSR